MGGLPIAVAVNLRTDTTYVANNVGKTVSMISGRTNRVITTIRAGAQPGAVAVNPRTDVIYVADEASSTLSVISGRTNKLTAAIRRVNRPGLADKPALSI